MSEPNRQAKAVIDDALTLIEHIADKLIKKYGLSKYQALDIAVKTLQSLILDD